MRTMKDIIVGNAKTYANKTAFIFEDKQYTYAQVNERINRLINGLKKLGLKKGSHVGIFAYNCPQYFEVFGVFKAGMVAVPLNYRCIATELEYLINNSEVEAIVVEKEFTSIIDSLRHGLGGVKHYICLDSDVPDMLNYETLLAGSPAAEPGEEVVPGDMAAIYYSSGTTGRPKGAVHTHKSLVAESFLPGRELTSADTALCVMPFFHVGGSAAYMFAAYAAGATIVVHKKFEEDVVLKEIQEKKITYVCFVPAMIIRVLDSPNLKKFNLHSLKTIAYTGAPIPLEALKRAIMHFGEIFIQLLGQTETLNMTVLPKADQKLSGTPKELKRLESAGKPPRPGETLIVDEKGNISKTGVPGEIACHSDRMMSEYWKMPEETAKTIKKGLLYTGDMGLTDEDGYIYLVDRKKDMIISGGENIYSREVEDILSTHPACADVAIIGVPDEKWGESVKAVIVLKPGHKATEKEIIDFCKDRMASYKKPKTVEFWDTVPKTATGKIKKAEIRNKYWAGHDRKIH
jgi:long-chain acyl-CoA synthetase